MGSSTFELFSGGKGAFLYFRAPKKLPVDTLLDWGINGHDLFPRGFVITKGGGATGQSQIYLWRIKFGELGVAPVLNPKKSTRERSSRQRSLIPSFRQVPERIVSAEQ